MVSISGSDKQVVHLIGIDLYDHRNEHTPLISLLPYSLKKPSRLVLVRLQYWVNANPHKHALWHV